MTAKNNVTKKQSKGAFTGIWMHGDDYYRSALILKENRLTYPYLTCLAFSVEIFIKGMHTNFITTRDDDAPCAVEVETLIIHQNDGHILDTLFLGLPGRMQKACIDIYRMLYDGRDLLEDLKYCRDVFSMTRYQYEEMFSTNGRQISVGNLQDIADFFQKYSISIGNVNKLNGEITQNQYFDYLKKKIREEYGLE